MSDSEKIVLFPDLKAIEEEAALWVARDDARGEFSNTEKRALKEWTAKSAHHAEALERMKSLWGGLDILDDINYLDDDTTVVVSPIVPQKRWWMGAAAAAALMLIIVSGLRPGNNDPLLPSSGQFATQIGGQETIKLSDGSTILLNTNSAVAVNLSENRRNITLLRGEAYFEVAPDPSRPFLVHARGGIVKAVGTAFTVFLHEKSVEVTVSEGVVALIPQSDLNSRADILNIADEDRAPLAALTAGQSAVFAEEVESLSRISAEALDRKLLWREGFIAFTGEPLSRVVADVSRYTDITIEIDDASLETLPIGGYFKVGEVDGMLESLSVSFGVHVERTSPSLVRLSRGN